MKTKNKRVRFQIYAHVRHFNSTHKPIIFTYDSDSNGHYISKRDREQEGLPII